MESNEYVFGSKHQCSSYSAFIAKFGGGLGDINDQHIDVIWFDHCYAKSVLSQPSAIYTRPTKFMFMPKKCQSPFETIQRDIDIVGEDKSMPDTASCYDVSKALARMSESYKYISDSRLECQDSEWNGKISRVGWAERQSKLFNNVIRILHDDRLARLAVEGMPDEPVAHRHLVSRTSRCLRQAFSSVQWDMEVLQWLHELLLDDTSDELLVCYLEAIFTLKTKIPKLIEKMINGALSKHINLSSKSLQEILHPLDPLGNAVTMNKPKSLPNSPVLLLVPNRPVLKFPGARSRRWKLWLELFGGMGDIVVVEVKHGDGEMSVKLLVEQMIANLNEKIDELRSSNSGRPIILIGWDAGSLVVFQAALRKSVTAVIALGFPFNGIYGIRGGCDDPLLGNTTPALFVVGQRCSYCSVSDVEDFRERMPTDTGMIVVGGADDLLRVSHRRLWDEGVTQSAADCCIAHGIAEYLTSVLSKKSQRKERDISNLPQVDLRRQRKRKLPVEMTAGGDCKTMLMRDARGRQCEGPRRRGGRGARSAITNHLPVTSPSSAGRKACRKMSQTRRGRAGFVAVRGRSDVMTNHEQCSSASGNPVPPHSACLAESASVSQDLCGLLQGKQRNNKDDGTLNAHWSSGSMISPGRKMLMASKFTDSASMLKVSEQRSYADALPASAVRRWIDTVNSEKRTQHQSVVHSAVFDIHLTKPASVTSQSVAGMVDTRCPTHFGPTDAGLSRSQFNHFLTGDYVSTPQFSIASVLPSNSSPLIDRSSRSLSSFHTIIITDVLASAKHPTGLQCTSDSRPAASIKDVYDERSTVADKNMFHNSSSHRNISSTVISHINTLSTAGSLSTLPVSVGCITSTSVSPHGGCNVTSLGFSTCKVSYVFSVTPPGTVCIANTVPLSRHSISLLNVSPSTSAFSNVIKNPRPSFLSVHSSGQEYVHSNLSLSTPSMTSPSSPFLSRGVCNVVQAQNSAIVSKQKAATVSNSHQTLAVTATSLCVVQLRRNPITLCKEIPTSTVHLKGVCSPTFFSVAAGNIGSTQEGRKDVPKFTVVESPVASTEPQASRPGTSLLSPSNSSANMSLPPASANDMTSDVDFDSTESTSSLTMFNAPWNHSPGVQLDFVASSGSFVSLTPSSSSSYLTADSALKSAILSVSSITYTSAIPLASCNFTLDNSGSVVTVHSNQSELSVSAIASCITASRTTPAVSLHCVGDATPVIVLSNSLKGSTEMSCSGRTNPYTASNAFAIMKVTSTAVPSIGCTVAEGLSSSSSFRSPGISASHTGVTRSAFPPSLSSTRTRRIRTPKQYDS